MARRRHGNGGRTTPKGTRAGRAGPGRPSPRREPDLLADVRARLATGEPLDLLAEVSSLVAAVDPRQRDRFGRTADAGPPGPTLDELVRTFGEVDRFETSALLAVVGELAPDELVRARARRFLAGRPHGLPPWLVRLGSAEADRAVELGHVLGDGDNIMVGLRLPGGHAGDHELSTVLYVDHNLGTVAKDGFAVPVPVDELVTLFQGYEDDPGDSVWRDLDPADARARIGEAIDHGALLYPPLENDTWPASRPLIEWVARLLPPGGTGYVRPVWDEDDTADLAAAFFASAPGRAFDDAEHRRLAEALLWFGTDYGPGDPLRWSPVAVELLLSDWIPRKIVAPPAFLSLAPDLLRAFIVYAHTRRGIRPGLTAETLAAVDTWEPEYQATIGGPRPQGPLALLAAVGVVDPDGPWPPPDGLDWSATLEERVLDSLRRAVGGDDALLALDDAPLPDEAFAWDGVPDDLRGKVGKVVALCDRCCDELLTVEYRTACRRLLARVVADGPEAIRRRGRADTAAAAVCWAVGKANGLFTGAVDGILVKDLMAHFGLGQSSVSQRAAALLRAAGIASTRWYEPAWDLALGDPGLLVSSHRRHLMERRDRYAGVS